MYSEIFIFLSILSFSVNVYGYENHRTILLHGKDVLNYVKYENNCMSNKSLWRNQIKLNPVWVQQYNDEIVTTQPNIFELWKQFPITILENVTSINSNCKKAYSDFLHKIQINDLDALKMFDANGKLSSGILNGNVNQYGDFDECLEIKNAQYCLAEIDFTSIWPKKYENFRNLIHSHYVIQETFQDPGHRVPGFTMIRWGFCIPRECSYQDLKIALKQKFNVNSRIRPTMCQLAHKPKLTKSIGEIIAKSLFIIIFSLIFISTCFKQYLEKSDVYRWINCFSIKSNFKELATLKDETIRAIDGVRGLSALALLMAHKSMALLYNPYINRTKMAENLGMGWSVIGRTAILYTDCFILLSGLLNAHALLSDLERYGNMKIKEKIINRLFRILPNLIAVILFCTYVLPSMGSGPLWPLVINHHSELCKNYMWRNMFLIHNYFGFENMCLTHTHQVGIDMQLFIVTPIFVGILWKNKLLGYWILGSITVLSTILRFFVTYHKRLSHLVYFGMPISRMMATANFSYILPTHRATIYLMGVYLAYILKKWDLKPNYSKVKQTILWMVFFTVGLGTWLGPIHTSQKGYEYNNFQLALYGAFSPIFWGSAIAWIIFATNRNYGGWLGAILEWKQFQKFTKIGYAVYLVQFPVFFYNVGLTRHIDQFSFQFMFPIVEFTVILILSVILTIVIEMPFQNIRREMSRRSKKCD